MLEDAGTGARDGDGAGDVAARQLATALQVGAYTLAREIRFGEAYGESRDRMSVALQSLEGQMSALASEFMISDALPDLTSLLADTSLEQRRSFLLEMVAVEPFAPYFIRQSKGRNESRERALRKVSVESLGLDVDAPDIARSLMQKISEKEARAVSGSSGLLKKWVPVGLGAIAAAGVAVAAGPAIAVLMPAASGLSGAAAVSAGLAQLGFGSLAAGGLGMTGGLWMLGAAGTVLGSTGTAATRSAVLRAVSVPDGSNMLRREIVKLLTSAHVAHQHHWFGGDIRPFENALESMTVEVEGQTSLEKSRNDEGAPVLRDLGDLKRSLNFANHSLEKLITKESNQTDSTSES